MASYMVGMANKPVAICFDWITIKPKGTCVKKLQV